MMRFCAALVLLATAAPALAQIAPPMLTGLPTVSAPSAGDFVTLIGPAGPRVVPASALGGTSTPATPALNVSTIGRDSAGRVTSFTSSGTAYTVTYDAFGPATIAGGGKTTTVTRSAQGAVTGISTQ